MIETHQDVSQGPFLLLLMPVLNLLAVEHVNVVVNM